MADPFMKFKIQFVVCGEMYLRQDFDIQFVAKATL